MIDEIKRKSIEYGDFTAKTLSEIVEIKSLSCGEKQVIDKIAELLAGCGVKDIRIDGLGSLIARVGHGDKTIAFDAHIDTVDTGDLAQWDFDPFCGKIADGKVFGRGTTDQKGGAASMITAARILAEMEDEIPFTAIFTFTVMEEDCDGMCWDYLIEREKLVPDFAVLTEPTNLCVYRGHRGRMEMEIELKGLSAHAAAPERGDNAVYKASRVALEIEKLNDRLPSDEFLGKGSVAVTRIESESPSLCAVPDLCRMHLDRRITWGETKRSALGEVEALLPDGASVVVPRYNKKGYRGEAYPIESFFPSWKTADDHPLVVAGAKAATEILGEAAKIGKWTFSTNGVSIAGRHGIPAIGFGPGNESAAHAPNETVEIEHLIKASAFYAALPFFLETELL